MSQISCTISGGQFMAFISTGQTASIYPIGFATKSDFKTDLTIQKVSSKDSGTFDEFCGGRFNWSISSDNFYSYGTTGNTQSFNKVMCAYQNRLPVCIAYGFATGTAPFFTPNATDKFTGCAIINSLSISAQDDQRVTFSVNLCGTGAFTFV